MATTTNWSITYPTVSNQVTPLATHFANLAGSTDTALTAVRNQSGRYTGTNAQRLALTAALGRTEGTEFYTTDTDKNWLFDGTNWISSDPGMFIVVPSGAPSGFGVTTDGSLYGTNIASGIRNFDNIFSSRFRNYRAEITITKPANSTPISSFYFRSGSQTLTAANYYASAISVVSGVTDGARGTVAGPATQVIGLVDDHGLFNYTVLEISSPFVAGESTQVGATTILRGNNVGNAVKSGSWEPTDSITGIAINFNQTISSCRIRFYGYA